jgi:hypothetical protein
MTAQVAYEVDYQNKLGQHAPMVAAQPISTQPTAVAYPVEQPPKFNPQYQSNNPF